MKKIIIILIVLLCAAYAYGSQFSSSSSINWASPEWVKAYFCMQGGNCNLSILTVINKTAINENITNTLDVYGQSNYYSNINMNNNNISNVDYLTANWLMGQPLRGGMGGGLIQADELENRANLNVSVVSGLTMRYPTFIARVVDTNNIVNHCLIPAGTVSVPDNAHSIYYIDLNCDIQYTSIYSWINLDLTPDGYTDIFSVVAHAGDIETYKGATYKNKEQIKEELLIWKTDHMSIIEGMNFIAETFPKFTITTGYYQYLRDLAQTSKQNMSAGKTVELIYHTGGDWDYSESIGLNMTYCDDGTDLVECSNPTIWRRYYMFIGGLQNSFDTTKIHQLATLNSETFPNAGNCKDTTTYPITYTLPNLYAYSIAPIYVYCGRPNDGSWDTANLIDQRTVKGGQTTGGVDISNLVPYIGANNNLDMGGYNITTTGTITGNISASETDPVWTAASSTVPRTNQSNIYSSSLLQNFTNNNITTTGTLEAGVNSKISSSANTYWKVEKPTSISGVISAPVLTPYSDLFGSPVRGLGIIDRVLWIADTSGTTDGSVQISKGGNFNNYFVIGYTGNVASFSKGGTITGYSFDGNVTAPNLCLSNGTNCASSGGNPFDQVLNTTDSPTFNIATLTKIKMNQVSFTSNEVFALSLDGLTPSTGLSTTTDNFVMSNSGNNAMRFTTATSASAARRSSLKFLRARGNTTNPEIVQNGDDIGWMNFEAFDGSSPRVASAVRGYVDGTPSANAAVPGKLSFWTTKEGETTLTTRWTINNAGNLLAGTDGTGAYNVVTGGNVTADTGFFHNISGYSPLGVLTDLDMQGNNISNVNLINGIDPSTWLIEETDPVYSANTYATGMNQGVAVEDDVEFNSLTFQQISLLEMPLAFTLDDPFAGITTTSMDVGDWVIDDNGLLSRFDIWTNTDINFNTLPVGEGETIMSIKSTGVEIYSLLQASGFVTMGGSSDDFVKGDGSLDSSMYLTEETDPVFTSWYNSGDVILNSITDLSSTYPLATFDTNNWLLNANALTDSSDSYTVLTFDTDHWNIDNVAAINSIDPSTWLTDLSGFTLDDLSDGVTYGKSTLTQISNWDAGYISSATAPLDFTTNIISISQSDTSTDGYLSSTDWNTFNNKLDDISGFTTDDLTEGSTNLYANNIFAGCSTIGDPYTMDDLKTAINCMITAGGGS